MNIHTLQKTLSYLFQEKIETRKKTIHKIISCYLEYCENIREGTVLVCVCVCFFNFDPGLTDNILYPFIYRLPLLAHITKNMCVEKERETRRSTLLRTIQSYVNMKASFVAGH
jgi:hypothetical protein